MTRLQVEVADFHTAASTMRHDVAESVRICLDGLSLPSAMVGEDPAGQAWSAAYDPAARTVLRATAQLINAAAKTSLLFAHCGHNYARAEAASGGRERFDFGELLRPLPAVTAPHMARSGGANNDNPAGWWIVEHTVGFLWPGGHQDQLRAAANEWRSAAGGIENVAIDPALAAATFARDLLPEADDIGIVCRGLNDRLTDLGRAYRALAEACDSYADHLDECHNDIRTELTNLTEDSAVTQGTGALLALPTLGGSEVAAQAAQAGRIAVTAARITSLIQKVVAAARRIATVLDRVHTIAQEVNHTASGLANLRLVYADVTNVRNARTVPRMNMTADARNETAAAARIGQERRIQRPLNRAEREHILDGDSRGGGHRHPGRPGRRPGERRKSPFPREWSDAQIIRNIEDIIFSPNTTWRVQPSSTGLPNGPGRPTVWRAWEVREGVQIRVAWEPTTGRVRTAFPDPGAPRGEVVP